MPADTVKHSAEETAKRLSAGRYAFALRCGRLAKKLQEGLKIKSNKWIELGKELHDELRDWSSGKSDFPEKLKHVEHLFPPQDKVSVDAERALRWPAEGNFEDLPVYLLGFADVPTVDLEVLDLKTGLEKEWHEDQLAFYKYLFRMIHGEEYKTTAVYSKGKGYKKEFTKDCTKEDIKFAWANLMAGEPKKSELCANCDIKSSCPLWNKKTDLTKTLLEETAILKRQEVKVDLLRQEAGFIEEATYKHSDIADAGSVTVKKALKKKFSPTKKDTVKEDYPMAKYPDYYYQNGRKLEADFGDIEEEVTSVTVRFVKKKDEDLF